MNENIELPTGDLGDLVGGSLKQQNRGITKKQPMEILTRASTDLERRVIHYVGGKNVNILEAFDGRRKVNRSGRVPHYRKDGRVRPVSLIQALFSERRDKLLDYETYQLADIFETNAPRGTDDSV